MALTLLSLVKRIKITDNFALNLSASPTNGVGASASIKVAGVNVNVGKKGKRGGIGLRRASTTLGGIRMTKTFKTKKVDQTDTPDILSSLLGSVLGGK